MAKKPSAGDLVEAVAFDARTEGNPDSPADYGNTQLEWVEQFAARAHFLFLRAGETVQAGRLAGRQTVIATIRVSSASSEITSEWRMRDTRNAVEYAVRGKTLTADRRFYEILAESGVTP